MNPESGILTNILQFYVGLFSVGIGNITIDALSMLQILTFFSIIFTGLGIYQGYLQVHDGLWKVIKVGGLIYIITNYNSLITTLFRGYVYLGNKALTGTITPVLMDDPSSIAELGIEMVLPLFNNLEAISILDNFPGVVYSVLSAVIIILSFYAIGIRMFLVYITFYTIATLGLIFMPGAALSLTRPFTEDVIAGLMKEGFKFMVLSFLVSVMQSFVNTWQLPAKFDFGALTYLWFGTLTLAFLCWYLPSVITGFFSGRINLTRQK